jgi:shikimate dehydrogenase
MRSVVASTDQVWPEEIQPDEAFAAVVGKPVEHSLSPVLHNAAYQALGLTGWSYRRLECDAERLSELVSGLDDRWRGLSVTMPGKRAALGLAFEVTERAAAVGAANTLVPIGDGSWRADCTDVDGVLGALRAAGGFEPGDEGPGVLLGAGGTAAAALAAFAELGVRDAVLVVREPARASEALATAERVGVAAEVVRASEADLAALAAESQVLISTLPAEAVEADAEVLAQAACVLDVVYHPWPTPLAKALQHKGKPVATGLDMLLHQAFGQVEQFTGHRAPRAVMRDALYAATNGEIPLPLD